MGKKGKKKKQGGWFDNVWIFMRKLCPRRECSTERAAFPLGGWKWDLEWWGWSVRSCSRGFGGKQEDLGNWVQKGGAAAPVRDSAFPSLIQPCFQPHLEGKTTPGVVCADL